MRRRSHDRDFGILRGCGRYQQNRHSSYDSATQPIFLPMRKSPLSLMNIF